ncbi:MAG: Enoyl-[acyl-carrier-protein] reductase [Rubritepida sp.]|nr:Enoyl-[acyl-carrier-protein] reductase [Rubritepida sp.]
MPLLPARGATSGDVDRSERVLAHCNLMVPVKAALENTNRCKAELGPKRMRANHISPGLIRTRITDTVLASHCEMHLPA